MVTHWLCILGAASSCKLPFEGSPPKVEGRTLEACGDGVDFLDGTYNGMGRGAGNCSIENLIGCLKNPKYSIYPVIKFIEKYMIPLRESGVVWGYDMQYLLTGILNQHPRTAISYTKDKRKDLVNYYNELTQQE